MKLRFFGRRSPHTTAAPVQVQEEVPGRRYREDVPYALPKDIEEGGRLNLQHHIFKYTLKGDYTAPLDGKEVRQILDIGSGTGIWGHEMAQQFPQARVYGFDLEPPQTVSLSSAIQLPPNNYHFIQGDVLKGLPFPDQIFDFTHQRMLCAAIPDQQWPFVLQELVRVTKPGGWVELSEVCELYQAGPKTQQVFDLIMRYLELRGISYKKFRRFDLLLDQAGPLMHIQQTSFDLPIGWKGHVGTLMEKDVLSSFDAIKPKVCEMLHIPLHEFDYWLKEIPKECKRSHPFFRFSLVIAQKPFLENGVHKVVSHYDRRS